VEVADLQELVLLVEDEGLDPAVDEIAVVVEVAPLRREAVLSGDIIGSPTRT
jgi:hypothetical protein